MTEPFPYETRTEQVEGTASRSDVLGAVVSFTHDAGGPAAAAYVLGQAIKTTGDVIMTKINANAELTKTFPRPGIRTDPERIASSRPQ